MDDDDMDATLEPDEERDLEALWDAKWDDEFHAMRDEGYI